MQNQNKLLLFFGKMDQGTFPDREARTSIARKVDAEFRLSWGHLFTQGDKPSIHLSDDGGVAVQYMLTTKSMDEFEKASKALYSLWDPWTIA